MYDGITTSLDNALAAAARGGSAFHNAESVEFAGQAIAKLAMDPKKIEKSGKIVLVCDLAREYGFTDGDGDIHDIRAVYNMLNSRGRTWMAAIFPEYVRIPLFVMHFLGNKF